MEQFCQMGEVLGNLKALMALRDENQMNQRQCTLLFNLYNQAFNTIAEEIKQHLRLEEKGTKWKALEQPFRDLVRVFKEGDSYIKGCSETKKSWWARAVYLHNSCESVEYHIHNLMLHFPMAIEAIEAAGEISGLDLEEMNKKRIMLGNKYHKTWNDPKLFQWKYGKNYLVDEEMVERLRTAVMEDKWMLADAIRRKQGAGLTKYEHHIGGLLIKRLKEPHSLHPSSLFTKDYQVRRRIGKGGQYKEIQWLGEAFVLRRFFSEGQQSLDSEIHRVMALSHPGIVRYLCGFHDEEKKEYFLVAEHMIKDLNTFIKEQCGPKRRVPLSLPVAIDIMLQVARGMEYLHSHRVYHGNLHPSNVLIKARNSSCEGHIHAKITGFDLKSIAIGGGGPACAGSTSPGQDETLAFIWNAPEVLGEQESCPDGGDGFSQEKADVYSFAMLSFQVLTGKVPFEDSHLKGEKMSRNIRAGERPLFPVTLPKYLATLIKRCWQADPTQRPTFSSICRILRYTIRAMVMVPQFSYPLVSMPQVDVCDIEAQFLKTFPQPVEIPPVTQIPFQLFSFRLVEMDRLSGTDKKLGWESASEGTVAKEAEEKDIIMPDKPFFASPDTRSTRSDSDDRKDPSLSKFSNIPQQDSVLASCTSRIFCSGQSIKPSPITRSISLVESHFDRQLQEVRSLCPEAPKNKPRLQKTTSSIEPLSTCDVSFLSSEKRDPTLKKCNSFISSKEPGISKAAARLSLQKQHQGNPAKLSEQGHDKAATRVSSSSRRSARNSIDFQHKVSTTQAKTDSQI